jgi:hypothetical protein
MRSREKKKKIEKKKGGGEQTGTTGEQTNDLHSNICTGAGFHICTVWSVLVEYPVQTRVTNRYI